MALNNNNNSKDITKDEPTVRFNETIYTDHDDSPQVIPIDEINKPDLSNIKRLKSNRSQSGILKRRQNTITTADAPKIILSDEGLKAGRVSPFINFPLFLSMTIRSFGIVFGDM